MSRIVALCLLALTFAVHAEEHVAHLSKYDHGLKLISFDQASSTARFRGNLRVRGSIFFEFDQDGAGRNVGVNFAKFVPDSSSARLLPAVVAGYYAGPVRYISLEPADKILVSTVGKRQAARLANGMRRTVSTPVELVLLQYTTEIECDSREYWSNDVVIHAPLRPGLAANIRPPSGC